jgi:hypothetical protein
LIPAFIQEPIMNQSFHWSTLLAADSRPLGISRLAAINALRIACRPLTEQEILKIDAEQNNPFPASDPMHKLWKPESIRGIQMPKSDAFPPDYLALLEWSNGGFLTNDRFNFAPLFSVDDVRGYMLAYLTPMYVPGLLAIGMDGGGNIHFLDVRHNSPSAPHCPVLTLDAGSLDVDDPRETYNSLWEACSGSPIT